MARKIVRLNVDNLADLPVACRHCVFWELEPVLRDRATADDAAAEEKESWLSTVLLEWGSCGRVAYVDGAPAGYALFAPPAYLPGAATFPTSPASADCVLLANVHVLPEYAGQGLGRVLMQSVVKDLLKRDVRAIEAFGSNGPALGAGPGRTCVIPTDFLLRVGFKTHRPHPVNPRLRLELSSVLTWREEVEVAIERLVGVVRPGRAPAPQQPRS
jgi:GNAT superfamily N-acetyltransferase